MKTVITILLLTATIAVKAQTVDTAYTASHGYLATQVRHFKSSYFSADSVTRIGVLAITSNVVSTITVNWISCSEDGATIENKTETITGDSFLALKQSILIRNNILPLLTYIGNKYNIIFK